jgi:serine kinase of HPr protein (carbohydrate metabolism regulator)
MIRLHGSCVALAETGVLLRGASGSGKSDLALRLIDGGALLVADDQVEIERRADQLLARPPAAIAGLLEVRGLGIVRLAFRSPATLGLVIDLVAPAAVERLPEEENTEILGRRLRRLALNPWEPSAAAKVRLAIGMVKGAIMPLP